jgi:hypothetical protein
LVEFNGMRFDVNACELCRITGVRNIRQALASPYPVSVHDSAQLIFRRLQWLDSLASQ